MRRGLAWVLACGLVGPGCAGGAGFGDETAGQASSSSSSGSGGPDEPATTAGPTEAGTTAEPEPGTSTTGPASSEGSDSGESSSTGEDTTTGDDQPHPELYPPGRIHSPISAYVADNLRAIAAAPAGVDKNPAVFAKIGGQTTASVNFMACFAVDAAIQDLPDDPSLLATLMHFRLADLGMGTTAFNRTSLAAMLGWSSDDLVTGAPTPIDAEVAAILPRFAHVLIGTHDLEQDQPAQLWEFADHLLDATDALLIGGVVPILSTLPQRSDLPLKDPYVPRYNAVIRAVAQGRQIPLLDLNFALAGLPMAGLTDGGDLSVFVSAMVDRPCHFSETARSHGYNVRNLEGLRALDRARQVVVDAAPELDPPGPRLQGTGTPADPIEIDALPFVDLRSTADSPSDVIDFYAGVCDQTKDESGPERIYRLTVDQAIDSARIMVFDRGAVDVDVHVMSAKTADKCVKRHDREVTGSLPAGTYYIAVDSFAGEVPGGAAGEYMLVVLAD